MNFGFLNSTSYSIPCAIDATDHLTLVLAMIYRNQVISTNIAAGPKCDIYVGLLSVAIHSCSLTHTDHDMVLDKKSQCAIIPVQFPDYTYIFVTDEY